MPRAKWIREPEEVLRQFALKFPEATEDHPWDHIAIKVKGKTFVFSPGRTTSLMSRASCRRPAAWRWRCHLPSRRAMVSARAVG